VTKTKIPTEQQKLTKKHIRHNRQEKERQKIPDERLSVLSEVEIISISKITSGHTLRWSSSGFGVLAQELLDQLPAGVRKIVTSRCPPNLSHAVVATHCISQGCPAVFRFQRGLRLASRIIPVKHSEQLPGCFHYLRHCTRSRI
jgi:hypothetical protein